MLGDFKINSPPILRSQFYTTRYCTEEVFSNSTILSLVQCQPKKLEYQVTHPSLGLKKEMETMVLQQEGKDKIRFKEKAILHTMPL